MCWTAVSSPAPRVSTSKIVVVVMSTVAAAAQLGWSPYLRLKQLNIVNNRQLPEDVCDSQNLHNLLPKKCLKDELQAVFGDYGPIYGSRNLWQVQQPQ